MRYFYKTKLTCSQEIIVDVDDDIVKSVKFVGGCNGNTKGISELVKNMKIDDVIERLEGVECNIKNTSCPDQIAQALKEFKNK